MSRSTTLHSIEADPPDRAPKRARMWCFTTQLADPLSGAERVSLPRLQQGLDLKSTGEYLFTWKTRTMLRTTFRAHFG